MVASSVYPYRLHLMHIYYIAQIQNQAQTHVNDSCSSIYASDACYCMTQTQKQAQT